MSRKQAVTSGHEHLVYCVQALSGQKSELASFQNAMCNLVLSAS